MGQSAAIELDGDNIDILDESCGFTLSTNHYRGCGLSSVRTGSMCSYSRMSVASKFVSNLGGTSSKKFGMDSIKMFLADRSHEKYPILRSPSWHTALQMTVCTVTSLIMDLSSQSMHIKMNYPAKLNSFVRRDYVCLKFSKNKIMKKTPQKSNEQLNAYQSHKKSHL